MRRSSRRPHAEPMESPAITVRRPQQFDLMHSPHAGAFKPPLSRWPRTCADGRTAPSTRWTNTGSACHV